MNSLMDTIYSGIAISLIKAMVLISIRATMPCRPVITKYSGAMYRKPKMPFRMMRLRGPTRVSFNYLRLISDRSPFSEQQ